MGTKPGQSHSLMRSREIVTAFIPVRLHAQGPCQKKQKGKKIHTDMTKQKLRQ